MFFEHDKIFNAENVFLVLDVFLFGFHEDVDLVQSQLHVLLFWTDYFYCDVLFGLVVECLNHFTKSPASQRLQQLVPEPELFMFPPRVSAVLIVLSHTCSHTDVVNLFPSGQLLFLVLSQKQSEPLNDLLPWPPWNRPFKTFLIAQTWVVAHH